MSEQRHAAKKQLGQHFLQDASIIELIIRAVDPKPGQRLIEIGPGQGALTLPLLRRHGALTVIELDRDLLAPLRGAGEGIGSLEVIHADVLTVDFSVLANGGMLRLVGNLPYNISSPILFHALKHAAVVRDMHFMLQKEVVERMAATPGGKVYGRLSVMLQACCEVIPLFEVPPAAFRPPPQVDSAVVRLVPRAPASIGIKDTANFERVVRDAFGQRRKTLRNALSRLCEAADLEAAGIRPSARAEELSVDEFIALSNHLASHRQQFTAMP
ncbi:MAG TPA: 16S rRNA (adenine(1518)-N(6)/adenine(1519)-N(6))-dimethyltransferase RsmA [Xanthomonadaceae bacterium]|jgi:16S rRNA (adenine1518-N6/adenine1519-N6)-dimethyltransferase|nr:16S rRNA (adenine(1518)-N(6)/adenine(1519)-N(6))-dimethyltransferase RsmA [Xanthomonadaceae bacterium]